MSPGGTGGLDSACCEPVKRLRGRLRKANGEAGGANSVEVGAQAASETRQLGSREHGRLGLPLGAQSRAGDVIRPGALSPSLKKMLQGAGGDQNAICN